jgi:hypothetical protein
VSVLAALPFVEPSALPRAIANLPVLDRAPGSPAAAALASVLRWALLALVGLAAAAVLLVRPRWVGTVAVLAVALTAADLVTIGRGWHPAAEKRLIAPPPSPSVDYLKRQGDQRRFAGAGAALGANVGQRYGLYDMRGNGVPRTERQARLYKALGGVTGGGLGRQFYVPSRPRAGDLIDVFAVGHVLDDGRSPPQGPVILSRPRERLAANPDALPRAWVAHRWRPARGQDAALTATVRSTPQGLAREPVIEGVEQPSAAVRPAPTAARLRLDGDEAVVVDYAAPAPGQLILHDTHYPGWRASVDGRPAPIRPANAAFRAVPVPAGRHTVTFEYDPASVQVGAGASALAVLVVMGSLLGLAVRSRRGRRPMGHG